MARLADTPGAAEDTLVPLRRPPVRQSIVVRSDRRHTFETFVETIGAWWPVQPFSAGRERVRDVTFEQRPGGRVFETWDDGTTVEWATVQAWEPPHRFTMSWSVDGKSATEVELTFTAVGPAVTLVEVVHSGWEALSAAEVAADCALPGGYAGGGFARGWAAILGSFGAAVGDSSRETAHGEDGMRSE
jgi:hypothetical protein